MRDPRRAQIALLCSALITPSLAEVPAPAPLEGQVQQTLYGTGEVPPRRAFLKTAFRSTIEAGIRQPITTFRLGKAIYWRRGLALMEDNLSLQVPFRLPHAAPPSPGHTDKGPGNGHPALIDFGRRGWCRRRGCR